MLLDTASLYFRAYFGVPDSVRAPDGTPVNAVRGLLDFIDRLVQDHRPDDLVACMDADWRPAVAGRPDPLLQGAPRRRGDARRGRTRRRCPDTLSPQVPVIEDGAGRARHRARGRRRGTRRTTSSARSPGAPRARSTSSPATATCTSWSTTRAACACCTRSRASARCSSRTRRGCARSTASTAAGYADLALLRGDPSDGLPGVPGHRREDGGQAAGRVRRPGRDHGRGRRSDGEADARRSASGWTRRGRMWRSRPKVVRVAARRTAARRRPRAARATPRDPAALDELAARWGLGGSLQRLLSTLARGVRLLRLGNRLKAAC